MEKRAGNKFEHLQMIVVAMVVKKVYFSLMLTGKYKDKFRMKAALERHFRRMSKFWAHFEK